MLTKSFEEMRKIDISPYVEQRDGCSYLSWARCKQLLHENGAETVCFTAIPGPDGSSLLKSDLVFTDKTGVQNRCYEVAVKITIDDKEYMMRSPVMNGSNPVKDNSMSQQRLWNAQARAFVKGVAIYTGLGFDLWLNDEESKVQEDDLYKHDLMKIKQRMELLITEKMKKGLSVKEIAEKVKTSEDDFNYYLTYYNKLKRLEEAVRKI